MAIPKGIQKLLLGVSVKTTKRIQWGDLDIPRGTRGAITSIGGRGTSCMVKFDNQRYGSFECWTRELGPA